MQTLGVLGGTFDPVHCGHLRLAVEMLEQLALGAVRLVPARLPPLRGEPHADAGLRLRMLEAGIRGVPGLAIDRRELEREGRSYTVDTLRAIGREQPDRALCLILGMDAFERLAEWRTWEALPELAHICVATRPGVALPERGPVAELMATRRVVDPARLAERRAGYLCVCEIPPLDVSATYIRQLIARGRSPRYLVPDRVLELIEEQGIYRDPH